MLYLDTLDNFGENRTHNQFIICHTPVKGLKNIIELTPSVELLKRWENETLAWEEFRQAFKAELREEYGKGETSRLRGLASYCLQNDVVIYSPEDSGEQTYRAILTEVINSIWERTGETTRAVDKATEPPNSLSKGQREAMEKTAHACEYFQPSGQNRHQKSCLYCTHLDTHVYSCTQLNKPVIPYEWI